MPALAKIDWGLRGLASAGPIYRVWLNLTNLDIFIRHMQCSGFASFPRIYGSKKLICIFFGANQMVEGGMGIIISENGYFDR